jgi:hypothetical protein
MIDDHDTSRVVCECTLRHDLCRYDLHVPLPSHMLPSAQATHTSWTMSYRLTCMHTDDAADTHEDECAEDGDAAHLHEAAKGVTRARVVCGEG